MARTVLSEKGQIVIPAEIRSRRNLHKGDRFEIVEDGENLILKRVSRNPLLEMRGVLAGTGALEELLRDHEREIERDAERERQWQKNQRSGG